jgi:hypothetical protein
LEQFTIKEQGAHRFKNILFYLILTMIAIYIAIPTYGLIRDAVGPGEAVFVLDSPLPGAQMNRPGRDILGKIHAFFFPSQEVPVPLLQRIDLKGRVVYTDQTPFVHGTLKLESTPRYTRTDAGGYFIFRDVEEGTHFISVLDPEGNVLAECRINVERMLEEHAMGSREVELIRLPDGTFVFLVPVELEVLEMTLFVEKDARGRVIGLERIELGRRSWEEAPRPPGEPGEIPVDPEKPSVPPVDPGLKDPEKPVFPPEEQEKPPGGSSGPGGPQPPPKFDFDVYDTATAVSYGREGAIKVNIFGSKKRLAPGMSGTYHFTVDNGRNSYPSQYDVTFRVEDTLPRNFKIPLRYRLQAGGQYVAGDGATWCKPGELSQEAVLGAGRQMKYTLEWHWPEGEQDHAWARFGGDPDYSYSLTIKVTAQGR